MKHLLTYSMIFDKKKKTKLTLLFACSQIFLKHHIKKCAYYCISFKKKSNLRKQNFSYSFITFPILIQKQILLLFEYGTKTLYYLFFTRHATPLLRIYTNPTLLCAPVTRNASGILRGPVLLSSGYKLALSVSLL